MNRITVKEQDNYTPEEIEAIIIDYPKLRKAYNELVDKFNKADIENGEFEEIIEQKDKKILNLEELMGIQFSEWHKEGNKAWRINPLTKNKEIYEVPEYFDSESVEIISFDREMITYRHYPFKGASKNIGFKNPISLYKTIGGKIFSKESIIKEPREEIKISIISDLKKIYLNNDLTPNKNHTFNIYNYLHNHPDEIIEKEEFYDSLGNYGNETKRKEFNKLLKCGLIKEFKKGIYQVENITK